MGYCIVTDLAGYKIYSKDGDTYTLVQDVTEKISIHTITGGDIETYVITSYDTNADGTTDQNEVTRVGIQISLLSFLYTFSFF